MTFLKVLLVILVVLWLISLIRIGGRVKYGAEGLFVFLLLGPVKLCLSARSKMGLTMVRRRPWTSTVP